MKRFLLAAATFFFTPVFSEANPNGSDEAKRELLQIREKMEKIKTVQADFVQHKELAMFNRNLEIHGKLAVVPPHRLAWHVSEPVRYTMIVENERIQHWDEDTDRVQTMNLDREPALQSAFEKLTVWFSGDYVSLLDSYQVRLEQKEPCIFVFKPKPESEFNKIINQVRLVLRKDKRYIDKLEIKEGGGDITRLKFINTKLNQEIDPAMWEVRPSD